MHSGATHAKSMAASTTTGVYMRAKREITFSVSALRLLAFSTRSIMRCTVESLYAFDTRTLIAPVKFTQPDTTCEPMRTKRGSASPVIADVSI